MKPKEYYFDTVPVEKLRLDVNEAARRLCVSRNYESEIVSKCDETLRKEIDCKFSAVRTEILYSENGETDLGFGAIKSQSLFRNLRGCSDVFIFAVTLGNGVDRLLNRLSLVSLSEHFVTDALASAYAEAAADFTESSLKGKNICRPRFSVGYGDFDIVYQSKILDSVQALKLLNINLSKSFLMSPNKTITAVVGIRNEKYQGIH